MRERRDGCIANFTSQRSKIAGWPLTDGEKPTFFQVVPFYIFVFTDSRKDEVLRIPCARCYNDHTRSTNDDMSLGNSLQHHELDTGFQSSPT
jgi:hypothetical protein